MYGKLETRHGAWRCSCVRTPEIKAADLGLNAAAPNEQQSRGAEPGGCGSHPHSQKRSQRFQGNISQAAEALGFESWRTVPANGKVWTLVLPPRRGPKTRSVSSMPRRGKPVHRTGWPYPGSSSPPSCCGSNPGPWQPKATLLFFETVRLVAVCPWRSHDHGHSSSADPSQRRRSPGVKRTIPFAPAMLVPERRLSANCRSKVNALGRHAVGPAHSCHGKRLPFCGRGRGRGRKRRSSPFPPVLVLQTGEFPPANELLQQPRRAPARPDRR